MSRKIIFGAWKFFPFAGKCQYKQNWGNNCNEQNQGKIKNYYVVVILERKNADEPGSLNKMAKRLKGQNNCQLLPRNC